MLYTLGTGCYTHWERVVTSIGNELLYILGTGCYTHSERVVIHIGHGLLYIWEDRYSLWEERCTLWERCVMQFGNSVIYILGAAVSLFHRSLFLFCDRLYRLTALRAFPLGRFLYEVLSLMWRWLSDVSVYESVASSYWPFLSISSSHFTHIPPYRRPLAAIGRAFNANFQCKLPFQRRKLQKRISFRTTTFFDWSIAGMFPFTKYALHTLLKKVKEKDCFTYTAFFFLIFPCKGI